MRVLTAIDLGPEVVGGAQITHYGFLQALARDYGHECFFLARSDVWRRPRNRLVRTEFFRDWIELEARIVRAQPDVVIGTLHAAPYAFRVAERLGVPTLAYLNSFEYCPPTPAEIRSWRLPFTKPPPGPEERDFVLRHAAAVVVNSEYLRGRLLRSSGVEAQVIYPAIEPAQTLARDRRPGPSGDFVVGVCGYPHKGSDIFLSLARRAPELSFLLVGAAHHPVFEAARSLGNVRCLPFLPAPRFLRLARVVIVPSQWPEPFGRVAAEAMLSGLPTLVSDTGGLREIAGRGPLSVRRFRQVGAWEASLHALVASGSTLFGNAREGGRRAAVFAGGDSVEKLDRLLRQVAAKAPASPDGAVRAVLAIERESPPRLRDILTEASRELSLPCRIEVVDLPSPFGRHPVDVLIVGVPDRADLLARLPDQGMLVIWTASGELAPELARICDQCWVEDPSAMRRVVDSGLPRSRIRRVRVSSRAQAGRDAAAALRGLLIRNVPVRLRRARREAERRRRLFLAARAEFLDHTAADLPIRARRPGRAT